MRRLVGLLFAISGFAVACAVGISPVSQVNAQSCTVPGQVQNVLLEYPQCVNNVCNFERAMCSWSALTGAESYNVSVTEVDTGTVVYNQSVSTSTLSINFGVQQGYTYKCDVSAVNSCGTGTAGTHSLLCETDALLEETPVPTQPPAAPIPTIPPTGNITLLPMLIGAGSILLSGIGIYFVRRKP